MLSAAPDVSLALSSAIAFISALVLTPAMREVFRFCGVVDTPDQGRKAHAGLIPRAGGVAIAIAYVTAIFLVPRNSAAYDALEIVWRFLPAAAVILATGVLDDLFGLKPGQKLLGQFGGATIAYFGGFRLFVTAGLPLGELWSFLGTVLWLLVCTNAFNLIDGLDGLAAGVGLFASVALGLAGMVHHNPALTLAAVPFAACLLGFLVYNFRPASVFLGDSGSLLIGFFLGCLGIEWSRASATPAGIIAPLTALSIPLLDTCLCVARRCLQNRPIFGGDRGHIHHKLLDRGLDARQAVLVIYAACAVVTGLALLQSTTKNPHGSLYVLALFALLTGAAIRALRYREFSIARGILLGGEFQHLVRARMDVVAFEREIAKAASIDRCWRLLQDAAQRSDLRCDRLSTGGHRIFDAKVASLDPGEEWHIRVPLNGGGHVDLTRPFRQRTAVPVDHFIHLIHSGLAPRLLQLEAKELEFEDERCFEVRSEAETLEGAA